MSSGSPSVSLEMFAGRLAASQLIPPEKWQATKTDVLAATDAKTAALRLTSQGLLSRWQASQLLRGNTALTLGRYRLIEQIGQSVFGKIYVAEHMQLARKLTLFAFAPRLLKGEVREGLMAKARSAAGLDHPAILRVSDIDHEGEQYYFVSPEITVTDVSGYVAKNGSLSGSKAAWLTATIAEALAFGAKNQVSHGWLCPSNVVLDAKGRPFVVGFGFADVIAKFPNVESQLVAEATEAERMSIPPESEGAIAPSPSVDAYALGQLLFLMATGKSPVRDELGDLDSREQIVRANSSVLPAIADLYAELTDADVSKRLTGASLISDRLAVIASSDAPTEEAPQSPFTSSQAVPVMKAKKAKPLPRASSVAKASSVVAAEPDSDELRLAEVESVPVSAFPTFDVGAVPKKDSSPGEKTALNAPKEESARSKRRKANAKLAMWVTMGAAACLFLVLLTGLVLWLVMPPPGSTQVAKNNAKENVPASDAKNAASKTDAKKSEASADKAPADKAKDTSEAATAPKQVAAPEVKNVQPSSETVPMPDPAMAKPEESTSEKPTPVPPEGPAPTPNPESTPTPEPTPPAPPPMPTDPGPPGGPLAKLPKIFELEPPSSDNANKTIDIGELPLPANAFATAILIGGDAAVKGGHQFSVEDKADNDWNVKLTATKEKTEKVIANLTIADGKLKFTWNNEGAQDANAVGLKNCILSLSAAGSPPHRMVLRTPVEFDSVSPTEKKLSVSKQVELAHLPSPERLRLQIVPAGGGMPYPDISYSVKTGPGKSKYGEPKSENELRPSIVWIGMSQQVKPFGFEIKPEVKGKGLTIAIQTVVRTPLEVNKQTYMQYVAKKVQDASKTSNNQLNLAKNELEGWKGAQPGEGVDAGQFNAKKDQSIKALTETVADLTGRAQWFSEADKLSEEALKGNALEFRLYYDAGESMQVEIAKSKGFDAAKK